LLIEEVRKIVKQTLDQCEAKKINDWSAIKSNIRDDLRTYLYTTIKRNPMILPIIMEV